MAGLCGSAIQILKITLQESLMNTKFNRLYIALILLLVSLLLTSCSLSVSPDDPYAKTRFRAPFVPTSTPPSPPYFLPGDCRFPVPPGEVRCGDFYVLEDRANPDSRVITLHVAVFPSFSEDPEPDPLIFLVGGGGADALSSARFYLERVGTIIRTKRDFILYNQRGVKYNDPYLTCPEEDQFWEEIFSQNLTKAQEEALESQFLLDCRQSLVDQGINLDLYDSLAHAADLAEMISVLGYEKANIFGVSYGTRTGLTLMRHHPELVRSAILDGVLPPQINFPSDAITSFGDSLEKLFAACQEQPACADKYPDLEGDFNLTLKNLNDQPVSLNIDDQTITLDHNLFMDVVFKLMHTSAALPDFPREINNASQGEFSGFTPTLLAARKYNPFLTTGVHYSTICRDEVFFDRPENSRELASQYPALWQDYFDLSFYFNTCQEWVEDPPDPIENTPVTSDIPALLLSGQFDPITSPAWSQNTADHLESSFAYEFPNMSHGVLHSNNCALNMGLAFLDDPWTEPESSCLEEVGVPEFR